jgi:hypothetical protein
MQGLPSELSLRPQDSFSATKSLDDNGAILFPQREQSTCSEIEPAATTSSDAGPSTPPTALNTNLHTTTPEEEMFHQQLEEQFRHAAETRQELASHKSLARFKIHDLLRNPELAAAAWQEMAGADDSDDEYMTSAQAVAALSVPSTPGKSQIGTEPATGTQTPVEMQKAQRTNIGKCAAELMRDRSTLDAIMSDANAEYKINSDISSLLISRLKAGRQALEAQHAFIMVRQLPLRHTASKCAVSWAVRSSQWTAVQGHHPITLQQHHCLPSSSRFECSI